MAGMEMRESMYNILICDDEKDIVNALKIYLNDTNYHFLEAFDGEEAVHVVETKEVHLVLMDIMMPKMDGIQAMIKIRERSNVPVILLTAKGEDSDKVLGLTVGADDYITKPFGTGELMARIRTSLRHSHAQAPGHVYKALDLEIDFEKRLIRLRGEEVHLTQIEYQLLTLLAENSGRVLTYSYIMNAIWGPYMDNNNQILRVNMANIRRKLEQNPAQPQYVFTEIGVGYRMRENENGGTV